MQTIICMKWGTRYDSEYVNRLYRSIKRHTTRKTKLICFTDNDIGISSNVICKPLPKINLPKLNLPEYNPNPASTLFNASPMASTPPPTAQGTVSPGTVPRMMELGMPLFQGEGFNRGGYVSEMTEPRMEHSGIMSVRNKPRQLVG